MAFIGFCLMLGLAFKMAWDFTTSDAERAKIIEEYKRQPILRLWVLVQCVFATMFVVGVLIPRFGEIEIAASGWRVWTVGFFGFFGMFGISLFYDINKLDKK